MRLANEPIGVIEQALSGKPVLLRNGSKAFILNDLSAISTKRELSSLLDMEGLVGITENNPYYLLNWGVDGEDLVNCDKSLSIVGMWEKL